MQEIRTGELKEETLQGKTGNYVKVEDENKRNENGGKMKEGRKYERLL